jgi:hypothetical protein
MAFTCHHSKRVSSLGAYRMQLFWEHGARFVFSFTATDIADVTGVVMWCNYCGITWTDLPGQYSIAIKATKASTRPSFQVEVRCAKVWRLRFASQWRMRGGGRDEGGQRPVSIRRVSKMRMVSLQHCIRVKWVSGRHVITQPHKGQR